MAIKANTEKGTPDTETGSSIGQAAGGQKAGLVG
jgi:hypothetical protein